MRKMVGFISVVVVALVLVASPGYAISGVTGQANSDNTILKVQVGNTVVQLGTDLADSFNTSILKSVGQLVTGTVGDATLSGGAERTATTASESGSESIGTGTKSIAGLANLTITSGTIANAISSSKVASSVDYVLANLNALAGFTNIGTTSSTTDSVVGKTSSTVSRDVSVGDVDVLDLGTLLDQLGVNPLALACAAIEAVGAELEVTEASTACEELDAITAPVTGALPVGLDEIDDTEGVLGTVDTALSLICVGPLATACDTLTPLINSAVSQIDAIQADPGSTCDAVLGQLAAVSGLLDPLVDQLNVLNGAGGLLEGLLGAVLGDVTGQVDALGTATTALDTACDTLLGTVEDLLDTALLSLDLVNVAIDLVADTTPTSAVDAAIGALKVGNLTVVDADDLVGLGDDLNEAIDTVESKLGEVLAATGLTLPTPVLDLLKITKDEGKENGLYFAEGALTVAHVGLPAANVELPASNPLDVISGLGGFAPLSVQAAAITTPAVSVDAGVFSGRATYAAAASNNPGGAQLPVTGVADSALAFAGMLTLIGAAFIRRIVNVF
jgi:hypothetical protein